MTRRVASLLLAAIAAASAKKDSRSSPWGNDLKSPMFLDDQVSVLEHLTEFHSLYIKHHSCVWSPYAAIESSNRANAAFSLYGVLNDAGVTRKLKSTSLCNQETYINSFFTTNGAATMSSALGINANYATGDCTSSNGGSASATMGCASGAFVYALFDGAQCDASSYLYTEDTMDPYNEGMEEITCTQVWDYDAHVGGRRLGYGSVAETILSDSKACSIEQYPGTCPDPFGVKERHRIAAAARTRKLHRRRNFGLGIMLMGMAVVYNRIRTKKNQYPSYRDTAKGQRMSKYYCAPTNGDATQSTFSSVNSRMVYYETEEALAATTAVKTDCVEAPKPLARKPTPEPKTYAIPDIIDRLDLASASSLSSHGIEPSDTMWSMYESIENARLQAQQNLVANGGDIPSAFFEALEAAWGGKAPNRNVQDVASGVGPGAAKSDFAPRVANRQDETSEDIV